MQISDPVKFQPEQPSASPLPAKRLASGLDAVTRQAPQGEFHFSSAIAHHDAPALQSAWREMLANSRSSEKFYQSPEFFQFLTETAGAGSPDIELLVARRACDGAIAGVVPVRTGTVPVEFRLGTRALFTRKLRVVQLLGSTPMLGNDPRLMPALMDHLLDRFPRHTVVSMQSLPQEFHDEYRGRQGLESYVINGWRECHTIELPPTFDEYLQRFSSKKRYNLARQVRLLAKEVGPVSVVRVDCPERIGEMYAAMGQVVPPSSYAHYVSEPKFQRLAANGLVLSYVIRCGEAPVAVVVATVSCGIWQLHNIFCDKKYLHLSLGTSAVHLALEDVITNHKLERADFGYGTPNQDFRSTHVLKTRGHLLVYRAFSLPSILLAAHRLYDPLHSALVKRVKQAKKQLDQRRAARRQAAQAR
jgi:hypothetical protein